MKSTCIICTRRSNTALCSTCRQELRDLLVGSRTAHGQPGIVWYAERLRETAYREARLGAAGKRSSSSGYALLADPAAMHLLNRLRGTLESWVCEIYCLVTPQRDEHSDPGAAVAKLVRFMATEQMARWLDRNMKTLTDHPSAPALRAVLLGYAKEAWRIINRPPDTCCGTCPTQDGESRCDTMLYADDGAEVVRCPRCRTRWHVDSLRDMMKDQLRGMLFSAPELRRLMDTRLADKMPKSTFYRLISDGRLRPRAHMNGTDMYTYQDVCAARDKPKPGKPGKQKVRT